MKTLKELVGEDDIEIVDFTTKFERIRKLSEFYLSKVIFDKTFLFNIISYRLRHSVLYGQVVRSMQTYPQLKKLFKPLVQK